MGKDFYFVLKVTPEATAEEIHSAYRRCALEIHPDESGAGSEPFLELQQAYAVLSDPAQRAAYDRAAKSISVRTERSEWRPLAVEPFRAVEPAGAFRDLSLSRSFDSFGPSFDELFDRLWSNFDLLTRPKAEQLESLTVDVLLTPGEAFAGGSVRIQVPARLTCPVCRGHGAVGLYECWRCRGQGTLTSEYPLKVPYPAGLRREYVVRVALDDFGIHNFYLTVRFRITEAQ